MRTSSPLLTRLPARRAKPTAALNTNQTRPSGQGKRKRDDDELFELFQSFLECIDNNNNNDDNDNDNNDNDNDNDGCNEVDKYSEVDMSWIDRWVDKPAGERGRMNKEGRPGWGKPEIMQVTGIMEAQYNLYMVCFSVFLVVELTDSISPRNLCIVCAAAISTSRRPSTTTIGCTRPSMASLLRRYVPFPSCLS